MVQIRMTPIVGGFLWHKLWIRGKFVEWLLVKKLTIRLRRIWPT